MQVCLSAFYPIKIFLTGNVHSRKNRFASSLNWKRHARKHLLESHITFALKMRGDFAQYTHTQCLKKL